MKLAHRQFLDAFEQCTLPPRRWTHEAHVLMAWLYLGESEPGRALEHIRSGIQRYNARALQRPGQYHETVTLAFASIIASRRESGEDWYGFARRNPDLFLSDPPILRRYYSEELLASQTARDKFSEPDLRPLPALVR